jgi:hypothetical protein
MIKLFISFQLYFLYVFHNQRVVIYIFSHSIYLNQTFLQTKKWIYILIMIIFAIQLFSELKI